MNPLEPYLASAGAVILDAALATELERRGADLRDPLWSAKLLLENPDLIRQVHLDYFAAGADVATSASYQATIPGLMERGLTRTQAIDILRLSVTLAMEARDAFLPSLMARPQPLVAASIGSYGAYLHDGSEFRGDYGLTIQQLIDWHRPRLEVLAASGADLLACETVPALLEAEALVKLLAEFPDTAAWVSVSCKDDRHLCHGEPFADVIALANDTPNIVAVGVNCTAPRFIDGLLASVAGIAKKPLLVYPNRGEKWDAAQHTWHETADQLDWERVPDAGMTLCLLDRRMLPHHSGDDSRDHASAAAGVISSCNVGWNGVYASPSSWGPSVNRSALIMSLTLLIGCQGLERLENRFVFHPAPSHGTVVPPPLADLELRSAEGVKIHARWCPHPQAKGVLIYCHGNAGNLEHFSRLTSELWVSQERSVLSFDYPGFGRSEGKPSEKGCYAAADAAYDAVIGMGISPENIVICGESLGGGVAVDLASRRPHQALVLIRTFTSIPDVAKQRFAVVSAPAIMVNRFESLKKIPLCRAPIFLAQADQDRLIPFAQGEKLRDACRVPVTFHRLRGLDHTDPLPADFFAALREFLQ